MGEQVVNLSVIVYFRRFNMSIETVVHSSNGKFQVHNNRVQQEDALFNIGDQECDLFIKLRSGLGAHIDAQELQKQLLKTEKETLALKKRPYVFTFGLPDNSDPTKKKGRGLVVRKKYVDGDPKGEFFCLINSWDKDTVLELSMLEAILEHIAVAVRRVKSLANLAIDE